MQKAAKDFPVTLWAYECGPPCENARAHLARRGVPYTEKDPRPDLKAFEKLSGGNDVPVLFVGSTKLTGYLESGWDNSLDAAGYPRSAAPTRQARAQGGGAEAHPSGATGRGADDSRGRAGAGSAASSPTRGRTCRERSNAPPPARGHYRQDAPAGEQPSSTRAKAAPSRAPALPARRRS